MAGPVNDNGNEVLRKSAVALGQNSYALRTISESDGTVSLVASQAVVADFESAAIDVSAYPNGGSVDLDWSGYDGTNGAANLQVSNTGLTDAEWNDLGGIQGALQDIQEAAGRQTWIITTIKHNYLRVRFFLGNGTGATISASGRFYK